MKQEQNYINNSIDELSETINKLNEFRKSDDYYKLFNIKKLGELCGFEKNKLPNNLRGVYSSLSEKDKYIIGLIMYSITDKFFEEVIGQKIYTGTSYQKHSYRKLKEMEMRLESLTKAVQDFKKLYESDAPEAETETGILEEL